MGKKNKTLPVTTQSIEQGVKEIETTICMIHDEADHALERDPIDKYDEVSVMRENLKTIRKLAKSIIGS